MTDTQPIVLAVIDLPTARRRARLLQHVATADTEPDTQAGRATAEQAAVVVTLLAQEQTSPDWIAGHRLAFAVLARLTSQRDYAVADALYASIKAYYPRIIAPVNRPSRRPPPLTVPPDDE